MSLVASNRSGNGHHSSWLSTKVWRATSSAAEKAPLVMMMQNFFNGEAIGEEAGETSLLAPVYT